MKTISSFPYTSVLWRCCIFLSLYAVNVWCNEDPVPLQLTSSNIDEKLGKYELVFVDFYADWCHFSQMLKPIFEEAAKNVANGIGKDGRVALAMVDCQSETNICQKYTVTKYPTMKLFRYGHATKKEYRAERSVAALTKFVEDQMKSAITQLDASATEFKYDDKKRYIVGHFDVSSQSEDLKTYQKLASILRDDCNFVIFPRSNTSQYQENTIVYHGPENTPELKYSHPNLSDYETLHTWSRDMCVPMVRELTFQNAEELTEEGLPFFIYFYHPDDKETPKQFREACQQGLQHQKYRATFLTADGLLFSHPLAHLGKSHADLPVIAIDSFKHMFVFPKSVKDAIKNPSLLDRFLEDLHSGKLHREFHYGPDPDTATQPEDQGKTPTDTQQQGRQEVPGKHKDGDGTQPPKSVFQKLQPSSNRYTILRDEL